MSAPPCTDGLKKRVSSFLFYSICGLLNPDRARHEFLQGNKKKKKTAKTCDNPRQTRKSGPTVFAGKARAPKGDFLTSP
jgi:hypothetical protein